MSKSKGKNQGQRQGTQKKGPPSGSSSTTVPAGSVQVKREWPLSQLFRDGGNGIFEWNPGSPRGQMGTLGHYKPLAARTRVRMSFVSSTDLHFTPRAGSLSKSTAKWTSGWVRVSDVMPIHFDAYGAMPAGIWRVECAGVVTASADFSVHPDGMPAPKPVEALADAEESDVEE